MPPQPDHSLPLVEVLEEEFRELTGLARTPGLSLPALYRRFHSQRFRALCLSGGGIRSATFALGVVQGLARAGLLDEFDYLSTVSGGGYLGGWLSAWISRAGMDEVIAQLSRPPASPREPEPGPVEHLRRYSNYLTPRLGVLSADAWTLAATYLRNLFLNWLALLPAVAALVAAPIILLRLVEWQPLGAGVTVQYVVGLLLTGVAVVGGVAAVRYVHVTRPRQRGTTEGTGVFDEKRNQRDFLRQCLFPLLAAVTAAIVCWAWGTSYASPIGDLFARLPPWVALGSVGAAVHVAGWSLAAFAVRREGAATIVRWRDVVPITAIGAGLGVVVSWLARLAPPLWQLTSGERGAYVWLAGPVLLGLVVLLSHLYVGYTSNHRTDAEREWSARFTAWMLIAMTGWFVASGLVIAAPPAWRAWIATWRMGPALAWIASVFGGASGIGAALVGRGPRTPAGGARLSAKAWTRIGLALATVFLAWLVVILAWGAGQLMAVVQSALGEVPGGSTGALLAALVTAAILLGFGVLSGRLIDSNMFSLHAMYRARLIRAYLGASRQDGARDANPFTGFDDADNVHLRDLWPRPAPRGGNQRPLHIVNATLNLVAGRNLAWQERKAASFTFSPLHCGSADTGYRRTQDDPRDPASGGYGGGRGVSLGTAMAISGAAASPDMGYHSSPVLSLILAFFNVRLGWWLGNPGDAGAAVYHRSRPESSLRPIVDEALGRTDDRNPFVYLSDGGHFENLGMYEMVARRCRTIVVSDASSDGGVGLEDLGNAIRKIRIDLGVPIDIDTSPIGNRTSPCALGRIRYDCVDPGAPDGTLVYLKPLLDATDPADVLSYAHANAAFPHETTADQWFTESQFESYRALGAHLIEEIVGDAEAPDGPTLAWFAELAGERARRR